MPKYDAVVAMNVPIYGRVVVEADSPEEAMEKIRLLAEDEFSTVDFEYNDSDVGADYRVLDLSEYGPKLMLDDSRKTFYEDIELTPVDQPWNPISAEVLKLKLKEEEAA